MSDEYLFIRKIKEAIGARRCIIYGFASTGRCLMFEFERFGIDIDYIVDRQYEKYTSQGVTSYYDKKYDIKSPYELANENIEEVMVLICVDIVVARLEIEDLMQSLGFEYKKNYYHLADLICVPFSHVDPTLGYSRSFNGRIGFELYGNPDAKYKILTLGGSTTEPVMYFFKSWPQFLFEKMDNKDVCVYNLALGGYDSSQEILKLIRDGMQIQPNIVISYSGYNDYVHMGPDFEDNAHPYISLYMKGFMNGVLGNSNQMKVSYGVECNKNWSQIWYDNERMMHAICKEMGVEFRAILQPWIANVGKTYIHSDIENKKIKLEKQECVQKFNEFYNEIDKMNIFSEWLLDGRNVFGNASDVFVDRCHVNEKGNSLIADYVYNILLDMYKR